MVWMRWLLLGRVLLEVSQQEFWMWVYSSGTCLGQGLGELCEEDFEGPGEYLWTPGNV